MSDRAINVLIGVAMAIGVLIVAVVVMAIITSPPSNAPCSEYGNYPITDVPSRCLQVTK